MVLNYCRIVRSSCLVGIKFIAWSDNVFVHDNLRHICVLMVICPLFLL